MNPAYKEGKTTQLIRAFLDGATPTDLCQSWDPEGGRNDVLSSETQLYRCAQAAKYLFEEKACAPLTVDLICEVHRRMFKGAAEDGKVFPAGVLRSGTSEVYAGYHQFLPAQSVTPAMTEFVEKYNSDGALAWHAIKRATWLFHELITIHPFMNGNGRLCRLFLSWSLIRDGFPFPISFSSGHRARRQHYLHAINTARRVDGPSLGELNVLALVSLEKVLSSYDDSLRLMSTESANSLLPDGDNIKQDEKE